MFGLFNKRQRPENSSKDGLIDSGPLKGDSISDIIGAASSVGISITPKKALGVVTVFACIQWRAAMIGHLPFKLHKQEGRNRDTVSNHPLALALAEPHEEINKVDLLSSLEAQHALFNQAFCQVVRNLLGQVINLIPIHPSRVQRFTDESTRQGEPRVTYFLIDGNKRVERRDMVHIKGLSFDGVNPLYFGDYAKECIGLAIALEQDAGLTFSKNVRFPNLLVTDNEVSETAYNRIIGWLKKTSGPLFGRLSTTLLDAGVKPWEPSRNYRDLEFDSSRKQQMLSICQMFRVPPHKIGILDNAIKANIESQQIEAVSDVLAPIASLFEAEFNHRCLTRSEKLGGYFLKFNLNALLRGTMRDRSEFYTKLVSSRIMNPNQVRELEDWNPYEGGDEFFGPMNEETVSETTNRTEENED